MGFRLSSFGDSPLGKAYSEDGIRKALLQEKVGKFLVDNAVQVEPKEDKEK